MSAPPSFGDARQAAFRWLQHGIGLLFARPWLWLGVSILGTLTGRLTASMSAGLVAEVMLIGAFHATGLLLAHAVARAPGAHWSALLAHVIAQARPLLVLVGLTLVAGALSAMAGSPLNILLWAPAHLALLTVIGPALLVDGVPLSAAFTRLGRLHAQHWVAVLLATVVNAAIAALFYVGLIVLALMLRSTGVSGLVFLAALPAAVMFGILPVLWAYASSQDTTFRHAH